MVIAKEVSTIGRFEVESSGSSNRIAVTPVALMLGQPPVPFSPLQTVYRGLVRAHCDLQHNKGIP
jgi:hypothetical protein